MLNRGPNLIITEYNKVPQGVIYFIKVHQKIFQQTFGTFKEI